MLAYKAQSVETLIILGLCFFIYLLIYLYSKKLKSIRAREKLTSRTKFIIFFFFIVLMFFIWIPGFWRVIAVLGFVAGAFVLTQKHNIENLFGYFIINWRTLFVVGDIIKIKDYVGKIKSLGWFYITLEEMQEHQFKYSTGNVIKIPNGFVSKHPLVNYSDGSGLELYSISYILKKENSLELIETEINKIIEKVKDEVQADHEHDDIQHRLSINVKYELKQTDPSGIKVTLIITATYEKLDNIQYLFEKHILELDKKNKIKLA